MNAIAKSQSAPFSKPNTIALTKAVISISGFWEKMEFNRFSAIVIIQLAVACVGGIAAAYALQMGTLALTMVALSTVLVEAMILAVMPMRVIFATTVISLLISCLVILI